MSRKAPNRIAPKDASAPGGYAHRAPRAARTAADLTADEVWFLLKMAILGGYSPADGCRRFFGFEATDADRTRIDAVIEEHRAEWAEQIECVYGQRGT